LVEIDMFWYAGRSALRLQNMSLGPSFMNENKSLPLAVGV